MFIRRDKIEEREYQKNIFESAKDTNTLVVLPTGLGKTVISVLILDYRLSKYKGSKALFVAPTKPLVNQHYKTFSNLMTIDINTISGEVLKSERKNIYETSQLVIATPQTIENDMEDSLIDFSDFSLLVVDEAHHTIGNYAYVKIAKEFIKNSKYPLIIGLSASPASDQEKINLVCRNLGISKVEIRGEDDPDVSKYVKTKTVEEVRLVLPKEIMELTNRLRLFIQEQIAALQNVGLMKDAAMSKINRRTILMLQKSLQRRMFSGNKNFYTIRGIIITSKLLKLYHALGLLSTQSLAGFRNFLEKIIEEGTSKTDKELANSQEVKWLEERATKLLEDGVEHPKLAAMARILSESFRPDQKAIIFTQYRDTVDIIYKYLESIKGLRPVRFIGQGNGGLKQKEQISIIKDFEAGVYNILVSTSVSEEGISIKGADLAIFYETIPSGIRSIQRRGRVGRFNAGKIFILITEGTTDEGYYWLSKRKESRMKKLIKKIKDNPDSLKNDGTLGSFV
jgi:Fanconi anemia group M protein